MSQINLACKDDQLIESLIEKYAETINVEHKIVTASQNNFEKLRPIVKFGWHVQMIIV